MLMHLLDCERPYCVLSWPCDSRRSRHYNETEKLRKMHCKQEATSTTKFLAVVLFETLVKDVDLFLHSE
jgi:hypothetical protein